MKRSFIKSDGDDDDFDDDANPNPSLKVQTVLKCNFKFCIYSNLLTHQSPVLNESNKRQDCTKCLHLLTHQSPVLNESNKRPRLSLVRNGNQY